jgi:hypothetical protein
LHQVDFNDLPRPTRERFVRSLVSHSPVARPICQRVSVQRTAAVWYALAALAVGSLVVLGSLRFGSPEAPAQDTHYLAGYVAGGMLFVFALSMVARRRAIKGSLPFAPGVYVFPVDLVDARTRNLVLYPLSTLQAFDVVHHEGKSGYTRSTLRFVFPETTFTFETRDRERADLEVNAVEEARAKVTAALEGGGSLASLSAVDPFAEARARNFAPARDHGLLARGRPSWTRAIWIFTLALGTVVGVASWALRNRASDERAFARLTQTPDVNVAEDYVHAHGAHAADVVKLVLPRAHLAQANRESDPAKRIELLDAVLVRFPNSPIDKDVRAALASAEHADFLARRGSAASLRAFIQHSPNAADVPAAKAAIVDIGRRALADYHRRASNADKAVGSIVAALFEYAETHGRPIDVRVRRHRAASMADADAFVADAAADEAARRSAPVSSALAAEAARAEALLVPALERTLRRVFGTDLVALRLGDPLDGPAPLPGTAPFGEISAPVIVVDYETAWARAKYDLPDPSARVVGIVVNFDVALQVPEETRVIHFGTTVDPPEALPFEYVPADPALEPLMGPKGVRAVGARVYARMLVRAFDQLVSRLPSAFGDASIARP